MAQSSDSENASDVLTIVNRSKEYKLSKQLICSKIPYFDKMCSSNLMESVDSEVVLDLDDKAFESLINWINSGDLFLDMSNVIRLCDCADYLMIDTIRDSCLKFFWNYFDIKFTWPNDLDDDSGRSGFLSRQLFSYLSRSFNIIAASSTFTELPFETVHYLCKVDACVKSELEIFDTFKLWTVNKINVTKDKLNLLMETIRWPYVSSNDLNYIKRGYKSLGCNDEDFDKISINLDLVDRRVEVHLIAIFSVADDEIELLFFGETAWTSLGIFKLDDKLSISLYSDNKFKTDIIYESGRKGIRIDWANKKYRYLEIMGSPSPYYGQLFQSLVSLESEKVTKGWAFYANGFFRQEDNVPLRNSIALLSRNGKYSHIDNCMVFRELDFKDLTNLQFEDLECLAARNSFGVYVIEKKDPTSLKVYWRIERIETVPIRGQSLEFENLELINHCEEIYVINKSSKEIFIYQPKSSTCKFVPKHKIINDKQLITVASASIPKTFLSN